MTRRLIDERPVWFGDRIPIFRRATGHFVATLRDKPGVERILLIGSMARGEPRPGDLDLAVVVADAAEAVPHVSKAARGLSAITHLWDVFVFDTDGSYVGRICQRNPKNCPTRSVECVPGCGTIKCLKLIPGFSAHPEILKGASVLWERG